MEDRARRFARIWTAAAVALFVVLAATVGLPHSPDLEAWERQGQLATMGVIGIGALLAWRWEGIGGCLLLIASASLGVFASLQHQPLIAFLPTAIFLTPAIAFLVAWHRTRTVAAILTLGATLLVVLVGGGIAAQAMYDYGYGPAHPQSALPDLPDSAVTWMWSGAVSDTSAVVVARVDDAGQVDLTLTAETGEEANYRGRQIEDAWRFVLSGLEPATEYTYQLAIDGVSVINRVGSFHTFSSGPASFRVAVGSCSRLGSNGMVYETIRAVEPDLFLVPGDFFYADHIQRIDQFGAAYDETLTSPAQAALLAEVPVAYVWDDHDFGGNDSGSTSPTRDIARRAFSAYVPHYALTGTGTINQAFAVGRVQFLMLDNRSARDAKNDPDGPAKTMLGTDQLDWLKAQLLEANDEYPLIVIVTSVPWIAQPEDGADHWGGYSTERQEIADFLVANDIDGVLMVAGDAHMIAIDDGSNTNYSAVGNTSFPLFHAAALDRPGSTKGGPYSEGAFPGGGQFGLIEVTDTGTDHMMIGLSGFDWTGSKLVHYSFEVSAPEVSP